MHIQPTPVNARYFNVGYAGATKHSAERPKWAGRVDGFEAKG